MVGAALLTDGCCNVPKPRCQEHCVFHEFLTVFWLWDLVKHFADLVF
jgi:hypothetical protein